MMFGHQDNKHGDGQASDQSQDDNTNLPTEDSGWAGGPADASPETPVEPSVHSDDSMGGTSAHSDNSDNATSHVDWQHPGSPVDSPAPISDVVSLAGSPATSASFSMTSTPSDSHAPSNSMDNNHDELVDIRQQALEALSPLVDKLDQPPEERFRTLMMMVQATDDHSLLPKAYAAAKAIEDDQVRGQALLDVVNEVNYFTHPQNANNNE